VLTHASEDTLWGHGSCPRGSPRQNTDALNCAAEDLKNVCEFVIRAIEEDGGALEDAAKQQKGLALKYALRELQADHECVST